MINSNHIHIETDMPCACKGFGGINRFTLLLLIILQLALFTTSISCVPLLVSKNSTQDHATFIEPTYVASPLTRGTFDLLWSCLVTYGICISTATHKDVLPWARLPHRLFYKMLWVLSAFLLPEFVFIIALSQLRQAMDIRDHWKKRFPDTLGLPGAFFVLMGGYTVSRARDLVNNGGEVEDSPTTLVTLTPSGFKRLVDNLGTWQAEVGTPSSKPNITRRGWNSLQKFIGRGGDRSQNEKSAKATAAAAEAGKKENMVDLVSRLSVNPFRREEIEDKGKADSLSKVIVSCQALWFLAQCMSRKLSSMPVTLTELHVVISIVYAAITYACWWYKPLDVDRPISITLDDQLWELLAPSVRAGIDLDSPRTPSPPEGALCAAPESYCDTTSNDAGSTLLRPPAQSLRRESGEASDGFLRPDRARDEVSERSIQAQSSVNETSSLISRPEVLEVRKEITQLQHTEGYSPDMPLVIESSEWNTHLLIYRMWHAMMGSFRHNTINHKHLSELAGMGLSTINGLLHGLAWSSHFPTATESLLWKLSCFGLFVFPFVTYVCSLHGDCIGAAIYEVWKLRFLGNDSPPQNGMKWFLTARVNCALRLQREDMAKRAKRGRATDLKNPGWAWLLTVDMTLYMAFFYIICMPYLAVEAFICIRSLPKGSYDLPAWADILPHI